MGSAGVKIPDNPVVQTEDGEIAGALSVEQFAFLKLFKLAGGHDHGDLMKNAGPFWPILVEE